MSEAKGIRKIGSAIKSNPEFFRLCCLFIIVLLIALISQPNFFSVASIRSITKQCPEYGILAIAMALTQIIGGINLSVVAVGNLSSMIAVLTITAIAPSVGLWPSIVFGIVAAVAVGIVAGILNGWLISVIGIPPILATLGVQQIGYGLATVISNGDAVTGIPPEFSEMLTKVWGNLVATQFIIFIIIALIMGIIMSRSRIGTKMYLIGSNPKAFKYAGSSPVKTTVITYTISCVLAVLAGLIMLARNSSVKPTYGESYVMQCILVSILGGVNPMGGKGSIKGIFLSTLTLQSISSLFNRFQSLNTFYREIIWGITLIAVMIINVVMASRSLHKEAVKRQKRIAINS